VIVEAPHNARLTHELYAGASCEVLEHHLESRQALEQRGEHALDEAFLAIEHIHVGIRDFAVHQEWQADLRHAFQHGEYGFDRTHSGVRVSRGAGRIELHAGNEAAGTGGVDLPGRSRLGEIERHQRLEGAIRRQRSDYSIAVCTRQCNRRHRRLEVRHDDRAPEALHGETHHRTHFIAIAEVQVPIVGPAQRKRRHDVPPAARSRIFCAVRRLTA